MIKKHRLVFTRVLRTSDTVVAICTFRAKGGDSWEILSEAVTRWVGETDAGRTVYADSCEDYNIGDLSLEWNPELLSSYGVSRLSTHILGGHACLSFDRHLVDDTLLEKLTKVENDV